MGRHMSAGQEIMNIMTGHPGEEHGNRMGER